MACGKWGLRTDGDEYCVENKIITRKLIKYE